MHSWLKDAPKLDKSRVLASSLMENPPVPLQNWPPSRERPLLSPAVRALVALAMCIGLGAFKGSFDSWTVWGYYSPQVAIILLVGFVLGWVQEKPNTVDGAWRNLRWRMVWYQAISWASTLLPFLNCYGVKHNPGGWPTFLGISAFCLGTFLLSEKLLSLFRCPHCGHYFFNTKADAQKGSDEEEGSKGNFLMFGMDTWHNTNCQHCKWPLWKPSDDHPPA